MVALAARAAGLEALDMVYTDLEDEAGLIREAKEGRGLGYGGKILIHPRQAPPVNRVFSPTAEEIEEARSLVAAFEAQGGGAIRLKGKMVDLPAVERARHVLRLSEAIAQRERR
jgi:citrate lyase subunit beta/citryl-CoA lyase